MKKTARAIDAMKCRDVKAPWEVGRFVGFTIHVYGDQASLHENGDTGTVREIRTALEWYCNQFGGKVKWDE